MSHEPAVLFGFGPWRIGVTDAAALPALAIRADHVGLDLLTVPDHPHEGGNLDAYVATATVLAVTTRLRAGVNVSNVRLRPAPMLARTLTTLQALSGDRAIFGVGAGGFPEENRRTGAPSWTPAQALQAMEESITMVRALSGGGDPVTTDGPFHPVEKLDPATVPAPPVWTGSVGARSLAVTGRLADGWIPGHAADWQSSRFRDSRALIDEAAIAAGRAPSDIRTYFNVFGTVTDAPVADPRASGNFARASVAQWIKELTAAVLDHGAAGFLFHGMDATTDDVLLGRWAEEIAPAVREAVA